ncbi:MAG TPA: lysophospholipid acyltransferase family protein [Anaerolineales bacterium]|nr:lysophospholipid acyltransferase family protein [Anaerolineales bacterium]
MKMTIFNTPILSPLLHLLAKAGLRLTGWKVEGQFPSLPKFVVIGAPHTSNWDFLMFLAVILQQRADVRFMGKSELFNKPFGWFFYWCGGIPVDRSKAQGLVEQMVQACDKSDCFVLTIAPEGTRNKVREWKRGFYHIAKNSRIPVAMAVVDGMRKVVGLGKIYHPTDDIEADLKAIQEFFTGMVGINPIGTSEL